jgi:hypothetical protein
MEGERGFLDARYRVLRLDLVVGEEGRVGQRVGALTRGGLIRTAGMLGREL